MVTRLYQYQFGNREGLILQYKNGWGEIAPLPGFSKESLGDAKAEILSILPFLEKARPKLPSVQFGVSCAQLPLLIKPLKVPICSYGSPEPNNRFLKIKVGHLKVDEAIALALSLQATHFLRIDCNRKWSLDEALYFASHFAINDFDYLEEPVKTVDELIQFSKQTGFPVAVDESLPQTSLNQIPTLKAVVVKPMILGSIPHFHVPIVLSSTYETSLGHLLIAQIASINSPPLGLGTFRLCSDEFLQTPLKTSNGFLNWEPSESPVRMEKLCLIASAP